MEEVKFKEVENAAWDDGDEWAFGEETKFTIPTITHNVWPHTNQGKRKKTSSACTIIGALNQLIRLFAIDLTLDESNDLSEEVVDYCTKFGYVPGYGRSTPTAINTVVKRWNEIGAERFKKEKVFWAKYQWDSQFPQEALKKGHLVGFTYALKFGVDRMNGIVYKDSYPSAGGHRTNWKDTKLTKPTGGKYEATADCGVHDQYEGGTNQYVIRDRSKYMGKGMYYRGYIILPVSCMDMTIEEAKDNVAETKAINYVLGALTTGWASVPEKYQEKFALLAKEMREDYKDARKLEDNETKKVGQTLADALSYCWKFMPEDIQKDLSSLASKIRTELGVK